jgi:glycosyltransferase involved in cell wall biosynthesis
VIYLYPAGRVIFEWIYLIYFKFIKRNRLFCDINELRVTTFYNYASPERFFPRLYNYIKFPVKYLKFKSSEFQALFYDGVIVISTNLEKYFSKYTKKLIRIPILCDFPESDTATTSIPYNNDVFRICFAGTLSNKKEGFDPLLKTIGILNRDRNVELHLYGYFPEFEESLLRKTAHSYNINDKVFYHGFLEPSEVNREFPKYHLLILPRPLNKQTKYGFSTKLAEYFISGVPTLSTDVSDNGIYIKDGFNGYLITPGSFPEMVSKINYIIDNYNESSNEIIGNAFRTARDNFDYRLYTDELVNFLFGRNGNKK